MDNAPRSVGLQRGELITLCVGVPLAIIAIILAKPTIARILDGILHLNPTMVYVVVGILVFAEAAVFFGFLFPGETAVILGGVVASGGHVNIVLLCAIVVVAAIVGDSVGYWVGHTYGERLLDLKILRHRRGGIDRGLELLRKRGGLAVFLGRFTAFLRAVMPGLAGTSKLHYRTFFAANAAGGIVWGVTFTLLGYFLGGAYHKAEKYAGGISTGLLITIVLIGTALFIRGRLAERKLEEAFEATAIDPDKALHDEINVVRKALGDEGG
ncbi:MAG: DedA family protein [Actinomycetes bacterium]